jgi:hypothetical protein
MPVHIDTACYLTRDSTSLYDAAVRSKISQSKQYTSTYFDKSLIYPSSPETVIDPALLKELSTAWDTINPSHESRSLKSELKNKTLSIYDKGWCYGLSLEFLRRIMENPYSSDIDLMKTMNLSDAMVYQATQPFFSRLGDLFDCKDSKYLLEKTLLEWKFGGNIKAELEHPVEFSSIKKEDLMEIFTHIADCMKRPGCTALRFSVSGFPGHSVACQISPIMRIFDSRKGIHTATSPKELFLLLKEGLYEKIEERIHSGTEKGTISIVSYNANPPRKFLVPMLLFEIPRNNLAS